MPEVGGWVSDEDERVGRPRRCAQHLRPRVSRAGKGHSVEEPPLVPHITSRCHVVASEGSGPARSSVVPRRKLSSPIASQPTP